MSERLLRFEPISLALLVIGVLLLVRLAPDSILLTGDTRESLLTSQAIVQHGTIRLDTYYSDEWPRTVVEEGGHLYYYFPLGTPLLSTPFVALHLVRGKDMLTPTDNFALQKTLSALAVGLNLALLYLLCRRFVGYWLSLMFTVVFVFGSAIMSTMATALFSINFAFVFMLIAMLLLVNDAPGRLARVIPYLLGGALFLAYLCRPTTLAFALVVMAYLLLVRRAWFLRTAATFALFFVLLVLFSWREFGQVLPSYYLPSRLGETPYFWTALYGNLASPSRGVFIYSPFLLAVVGGLVLVWKRIWREPLLWLALVWIGLHLLSISRLEHWWGGWSFGSRFMAETLIAWLLIALLVWREGQRSLAMPAYTGLNVTFIALGAVSIYLNTFLALFNPATVQWNLWHRPLQPDERPQSVLMLDWKYPQFLASPARLEARHAEYRLAESLRPLALDEKVDAASTAVVFDGWRVPEIDSTGVWRWSDSAAPVVLFRVDPSVTARRMPLALHLSTSAREPLQAAVRLNGRTIGTISNPGDGAAAQHVLPFDSSLLAPPVGRRYNMLEFSISGGTSAGEIAVGELRVQAGDPPR